MLRLFVLLAGIAAVAQGYGMGAPNSDTVCKSMIPGHPADPQKRASPYSVSLDKTTIKPGDEVKVTIAGENGEKFKGHLVQCHDGADKIVGTFKVPKNDKLSQTKDCLKESQNTVTHVNNDDKTKVEVTWVAPNDLQGPVVCLTTFVKDGLTFWVGVKSAPLTVQQ